MPTRQTFEGIGEEEGLEAAQAGMQKLYGLVRKLATEIRDVAPDMIYGQASIVIGREILCHGTFTLKHTTIGLMQIIGQLLELQFTNVIQRVLAMRVRCSISLSR